MVVLERPQGSMSAGQNGRSPAQSMQVYLRELTATCGAPRDKGHLAKRLRCCRTLRLAIGLSAASRGGRAGDCRCDFVSKCTSDGAWPAAAGDSMNTGKLNQRGQLELEGADTKMPQGRGQELRQPITRSLMELPASACGDMSTSSDLPRAAPLRLRSA